MSNQAIKSQNTLCASDIKNAKSIFFSGNISSEDAQILQGIKKKFGTKLLSPLTLAYKNFLQQYALISGKNLYDSTAIDIQNSDGIIIFGTRLSCDNKDVFNAVWQNKHAKIVYMHPIEEVALKSDIFVKYEPSSEHGVAALLALLFSKNIALDKTAQKYIESLDDGFLSGEASFDETEQEEIIELFENAQNKLLIIGADLYLHHDANIIAKTLGLLDKYCGFKILMLSPEQNSLAVASICDLDTDAPIADIGLKMHNDILIDDYCSQIFDIDNQSIEGKSVSALNIIMQELGIVIENFEIKIHALEQEIFFEDIVSINEMNGALAYFCCFNAISNVDNVANLNITKTKDIIQGSKAFGAAAKILHDTSVIVKIGNKEVKKMFVLDDKMKGTVALIEPQTIGYRFVPVILREDV